MHTFYYTYILSIGVDQKSCRTRGWIIKWLLVTMCKIFDFICRYLRLSSELSLVPPHQQQSHRPPFRRPPMKVPIRRIYQWANTRKFTVVINNVSGLRRNRNQLVKYSDQSGATDVTKTPYCVSVRSSCHTLMTWKTFVKATADEQVLSLETRDFISCEKRKHANTGDFYRKRREMFISCEKLHTCAHEQFLSQEIYR